MQYVYFAENKLKRFHNSLVERTEVSITKKSIKDVSIKAEAKVKTKVGALLSRLGIADGGVEAGVSTTGQLAFSKEVVSQFAPEQKLKAILLKLGVQNRLVDLDDWIQATKNATNSQYVTFSLHLQVDMGEQSEEDIERRKQVIFSGEASHKPMLIRCSLCNLESEACWRRFSQPRPVIGFGTAMGSSCTIEKFEIDPIVFAHDVDF